MKRVASVVLAVLAQACVCVPDPVPFSSLDASVMVLTERRQEFAPYRDTAVVTFLRPNDCPPIAGTLTATLNGQPLALVERGGPKPLRLLNDCRWLSFQGKEPFPREVALDVVVTDGTTRFSASFPPLVTKASARLTPVHLKDGVPLLVHGAKHELTWEGAPLVEQLKEPPRLELDPRAGFVRATHTGTVTSFSTEMDPGALVSLRGRGAVPSTLRATYVLEPSMGFEPVTRCEGVANCRIAEPQHLVQVELPVLFVAELPAGSEGGACYGNGTCDAPLRCVEATCQSLGK